MNKEQFWYERRSTFILAIILFWLFYAILMIFMRYDEVAATYGDPDNAMRMVQMRMYLSGQSSWYDLYVSRMDPARGVVMHWSRLIDAGQAAMIMGLRPFMGAQSAEFWMKMIWPLIWLLPTLAGVALITRRLAGPIAGLCVLGLFLAPNLIALRFLPGNIDHHNLQIMFAVIGVAAVILADKSRAAAICAGLIAGGMMAIGLENVLFPGFMIVVISLRFIFAGEETAHLKAFGVSLALSSLLALTSALPPSRWGEFHCDAIALNIALPVIVVGFGLAVIGMMAKHMKSFGHRFISVGTLAMVSAALFVYLYPDCLRGPFAEMDPRLYGIWLDHVTEARSFEQVFSQSASDAFKLFGYVLLVLVGSAAMLILQRPDDKAWWVAWFALLVSVVMSIGMVKSISYAMVLAAPLAMACVIRLLIQFNVKQAVLQVLCVLFCLPAPATLLLALAINFTGFSEGSAASDSEAPAAGLQLDTCTLNSNLAALDGAKPGLIINDSNYGPAILANTRHSVTAAPYHRISEGMVISNDVLEGALDKAEHIAKSSGADYVLVCDKTSHEQPKAAKEDAMKDGKESNKPKNLRRLITSGEVPNWLEPVALKDSGPIKLFRIR